MIHIDDGNYTYHWEITERRFYFFQVIGATQSAIVHEVCSVPPSPYDGLLIYIPKDWTSDMTYLEQIEQPLKKTNDPRFSGKVRNDFRDYDRRIYDTD